MKGYVLESWYVCTVFKFQRTVACKRRIPRY